MALSNSLLVELENSAIAGDPTARLVLENPLSGFILKELVQLPYPAYMRFDVPATDIFLSEGKRRLIAGYANVAVIDKQNELITLKCIEKAWDRMKAAGEQYANVNLEHSNMTLGKILLDEHFKDSKGVDHWSHVDGRGLYVLCELRTDLDIADKVWGMANKGELNAFSIGGRVLPGGKNVVDKGSQQPYWEINNLELYEITLCQRGMNPLSGFQVLKGYLDSGLIDQDMYVKKSAEIAKANDIILKLLPLVGLAGKEFTISEGFVSHIPSITKNGDGKFNIAVKMDQEDPMWRLVEKSILKAIPQQLWDNINFAYKDSGVFADDATPLFDLALVPVEKREDGFGNSDFPDSCFAFVPEDAKGPNGKKSLRKLPYKNRDGSIDLPHVRNALARLDQIDGIPSSEKSRIRVMLERHLSGSKEKDVSKTESVDTGVPVLVLQTEPEKSTLKKMEDNTASEGNKMSTPTIVKNEGIPAPAPAGAPNELEVIKGQLAKMQADIEAITKAPSPMPAPTGGTANPMAPGTVTKEDEAKKPEDKKPEEEEDEEAEKSVDAPIPAELMTVLDGLSAKGTVPPQFKKAYDAAKAKCAKADPVAELSAIVAGLAKSVGEMSLKIDAVAKSATPVDVSAIAKETATILKSEGAIVRKSEAIPSVAAPQGATEQKPMNLQSIHGMKWSEVDAESERRRAGMLQ